jgi:hypothetical protein
LQSVSVSEGDQKERNSPLGHKFWMVNFMERDLLGDKDKHKEKVS